jgi:large subunit ribosomal protein L14e
MFELGRICMKIAGRDANKYCVVLDNFNDGFVLVDGQTRRKKVNMKHLEPTKNKISIKQNADHSIVVEEFSKLGFIVPLKKSKPLTKRPKKLKVVKEKIVKEKKEKPKKEDKTVETKVEKKLEKNSKEKTEIKTEEKPKVEPELKKTTITKKTE